MAWIPALQPRHQALFTRPYRPQTNGKKGGAFHSTALREWAYVRSYSNTYERAKAWLSWLLRYMGIVRTPAWTANPLFADLVIP